MWAHSGCMLADTLSKIVLKCYSVLLNNMLGYSLHSPFTFLGEHFQCAKGCFLVMCKWCFSSLLPCQMVTLEGWEVKESWKCSGRLQLTPCQVCSWMKMYHGDQVSLSCSFWVWKSCGMGLQLSSAKPWKPWRGWIGSKVPALLQWWQVTLARGRCVNEQRNSLRLSLHSREQICKTAYEERYVLSVCGNEQVNGR